MSTVNFARVSYFVTAAFLCAMFSNLVIAQDDALEICLDTFWQMYGEMRAELGARFDVVTCGRDFNMPYVAIGVTLTAEDCQYDEPSASQTNFYVRGKEPKSYLEYKIEKECSIQGPISCGDEYIVNTTVDIQFGEDGKLGAWKKFVSDDVCEMALADYEADQE